MGAACGSPSSSAGSWISPPPPTTASTNPAATAASPSRTSTVSVGSSTGDTLGTSPRLGSCGSSRCSPRRPRSCSRSAPADDVVGVTFECDTPRRGAQPDDRLDVGDAVRADARRDRRVRRGRGRRGEDLYHLAADALRWPRPHAGRHPGPVRGLRGRRHDRRRRARPPRLHGRGAHRRPAHPRGGARLGAAARPGHRARGGRRRARPVAAAADGRGLAEHDGPRPAARRRARVDRPAVRPRPLDPRDGRARRRRDVLGAAGQKSVRVTLGRRRAPPARTSSWWRRAATTARGAQAQADAIAPTCCPPASACTRSTPTACGPGPARGSSTASRSWPRSSRGADGGPQPRRGPARRSRSPPRPGSAPPTARRRSRRS